MSIKLLTFNELICQLKLDPKLRILFVEGGRDLAFWRKLAPINQRHNSTIYNIQIVELDCNEEGGNKGRLIELAKKVTALGFIDRVKVFVDADNDHVLPKEYPDNVILTDYRDLESYGFSMECVDEIVSTGLAKEKLNTTKIIDNLIKMAYPIGVLRVLSEEGTQKLRFSKTFQENGRKKYVDRSKRELKIEGLLRSLLQNSDISLNLLAHYQNLLNGKCINLGNLDKKLIIHGKDWIFFLGIELGINPSEVEPLVFMGINYEHLLFMPSINMVRTYLLEQQLAA